MHHIQSSYLSQFKAGRSSSSKLVLTILCSWLLASSFGVLGVSGSTAAGRSLAGAFHIYALQQQHYMLDQRKMCDG